MCTERDQALTVIGRIYDAALNPLAWTETVRAVVDFIGGSKGLLFTSLTTPKQGGFAFPYRVSASMLQQWQDKYIDDDLWSKSALRKGMYVEGVSALGTDFVTEEEFRESRVYRELAQYEGIGQLCTGVVFGPESRDVPPAVCSVFRSLSEERFGDRERDRMGMLVPHLSRALGVMFRLRDAQFKTAASLAALDRLASGVVLLGSRSQVAFINYAAQRILSASDGLAVRNASFAGGTRYLVAEQPAARSAIEAALADCLDESALRVPHFSRGVTVPRSSRQGALVLQFAPLPATNEFGVGAEQARAIVFITAPDDAIAIEPSKLAAIYGLTPAETRLALQVCRGETLANAARRSGIALSTARSQLRSIFAKTHVSRQAELVRLLLSLGSVR